jgi:DNA polymerase-3 subunit beta
MKLSIAKDVLLQALQKVQNVVGVRSTLPVLSNVLISADKTGVTLSTTDLEVSMRCTAEATVQKTGSTTLPVRRLSGIVRELPETDISIEVSEDNVAALECNSSYFKIIGIASEEFPPMPKPEGKRVFEIDQGAFREMLRKTSYSASTDETRFMLNGVLLSFRGGKITMVATDGRRLALVEHEVEFPKESEVDAILPSKTVNELIHTLQDEGPLRITVSENQAMFEFGDSLLCSKLIDGTYPNFRQVIPTQCEERIAVEREGLLNALKRVSLVTTDKSNATKYSFAKNRLTITTVTPDVGEARETLPVKYAGKEKKVAFNPEFVMDALRNLGNDEIYFELTDEISPGVIKCDIPFLYVLMPMRVGD